MASQSIWQFFLPRFLSFAYPKLLTVRAAFANKKSRQSGNVTSELRRDHSLASRWLINLRAAALAAAVSAGSASLTHFAVPILIAA